MGFRENIEKELSEFSKISLQEMDSVALMDRVDVKYVLPVQDLSEILKEAKAHYKILSIENNFFAPYETLYYDSPYFDLYHLHQSGRLNRHKIRYRKYMNTGASYFEIKFKNNRKRTIKTRIPTVFDTNYELNSDSRNFLNKDEVFKPTDLQAKLWVNYTRLTLVNIQTSERVTIDLDLTFKNEKEKKSYDKIVIVEVKQTKNKQSAITEIFRKYNFKQGSISKYCLGIMSLYPEIKYNRFKKKYLHLKKIESQYEYSTNSN